MPRGHPEALSDAWGNLYEEIADAIEERRRGRALTSKLDYPGIAEGASGVAFIRAAIESDSNGSVWTPIEAFE